MTTPKPETREFVREAVLDRIHVRGDGRTISARVVPFDTPVEIPSEGIVEVVKHGAFRSWIASGRPVPLMWKHDRRLLPLGRSTGFQEERDGLHGDFQAATTERGSEALQLVKDGLLDSVSMSFVSRRSRVVRGVTERLVLEILEVSLVDQPAYADAVVTGVREGKSRDDAIRWQEWVKGLRG